MTARNTSSSQGAAALEAEQDAAHLRLRDAALSGDEAALDALVDLLLPVVRCRAARVLVRHPTRVDRDAQQEVDDLSQEALAFLFAGDGAALRRWEPGRGLSLRSFAGLLAERTALQVLRSRRQSPWSDRPADPEDFGALASGGPGPDARAAASHDLERLLDEVRARLSPKAALVFELAVVQELSVEEVCARLEMTATAVYAWRARVRKICEEVAAELSDPTRRPHKP